VHDELDWNHAATVELIIPIGLGLVDNASAAASVGRKAGMTDVLLISTFANRVML